jgi:hypothetical protein
MAPGASKLRDITVLEIHIALASFTTADVGAIKFSLEGERFLRESSRNADFSQPLAERCSNVQGF